MNGSARIIRALAALAVFASVPALTTQAFATISDPTIDQRTLIGTDVVTPIIAGVEPAPEPRVPLIKVAPHCPGCDMFDDG